MENNQKDNQQKKEKEAWAWIKEKKEAMILICFSAFILFLVAFIYYVSAILDEGIFKITSENATILGTAGDFFGGVLNPCIGAVTLYYLYQSYQTQKEEFSALYKANKETCQAAQEQVELLKLQNQHDLTFKMMERCDKLHEEYFGILHYIKKREAFPKNPENVSYPPDLYRNFSINVMCFFHEFDFLLQNDKIDKESKKLFKYRFLMLYDSFCVTQKYLSKTLESETKDPDYLKNVNRNFEKYFEPFIKFCEEHMGFERK